MKIHIETERLLMRDLSANDALGIFELDSDPEVHAFLGKNPIHTIAEAEQNILHIQKQYIENGIGRWAVIEKANGNLVGWSGFKLITEVINGKTQYYDLGYRFIKQYWGKGFATETANASLAYGFTQLDLHEIFAMADAKNVGSDRILQKIGMVMLNEFMYDNVPHNFYTIKNENWKEK